MRLSNAPKCTTVANHLNEKPNARGCPKMWGERLNACVGKTNPPRRLGLVQSVAGSVVKAVVANVARDRLGGQAVDGLVRSDASADVGGADIHLRDGDYVL